MLDADREDRFVQTVLFVGLSVFLFACGAGEPPGDQASMPSQVPPAQAGITVLTEPQQIPPGLRPDVPAAQPPGVSAGPAPTASPAGSQAAGSPAQFGSSPEPDPDPEPEPVPEPARPVRGDGGERVYSNKDLLKYARTKEQFGFRDGVQVVDLTSQQSNEDPAADDTAASGSMTGAEIEAELSRHRGRVMAVEKEIQHLRSRIPSLHNPFLPRVAPSEEDRTAEAGLDNAERLARVNQRIAELGGEVEVLRRRIAELYNMKPSDAITSGIEEADRNEP